jgi:CRISPR-associated protein Cmr2
MSIWKLKLKAFLHDPLDKQWILSFDNDDPNTKAQLNIDKFTCPKNKNHKEAIHEIVAEKFLNYILPGECIEELLPIIKIADRISYPMNEVLSEKLKSKTEKIRDHKDICFRDIYIEKLEENVICKDFENKHQELEEFFKLLGNVCSVVTCNDEEKAKLAFLLLWQYVPDLFKWVNIHPADSRIPSHSIYNHLVQTSAITTAIIDVDKVSSEKLAGSIPAFLLFTIGPVQSFISTARKTQDLWAGSYILSYLTYKCLEPLIDELGPDIVIYPNLRGQPLIERWIYKTFSYVKDENNHVKKFIKFIKEKCCNLENEDNEKLLIANIPNRFLAIIPNSKNTIVEECKRVLENVLKNFAMEIVNIIKEQYLEREEINPSLQNEIESQLISYFQIYYAILPWTTNKCNQENCGNIPGGLNCKSVFYDHKILFKESEIRNLIEEIIRVNQGLKSGEEIDPSNAGIGRAYPLLLDLLEKLLGARKSIRDIKFIPYYNREKCHLCGENEIVFLAKDEEKNKLYWHKLREKNPGLLKQNERLCGICLFKRLFPKLLEKEFGFQILSFPSTSEIASIPVKVELLKSNQRFIEEFVEKYNKFKKSIEASGKKLSLSETVPALKKISDDKHQYFCSIDGQWLMEESYSKDDLKNELGIENIDESVLENMRSFLKSANLNFSRYFAILQMDGDHMGKWIRGFGKSEGDEIKFPTIGETIHPKVYDELLKNSNDIEKLKDLEKLFNKTHPVTPTYHQILSSRLCTFALHAVRRIVEEKYFGKLIYAGGDDVLALLPVNTVLNCAYELQEQYKKTVNSRATMSAGIVIAHHKYPLSLALKAVRSAEKKAKNKLGRNAFCVQLITHSGEIRECGGKWNLVEFINNVRNDLQNGSIPKVFCDQIVEVMNHLLDTEQEYVSRKIVDILELEIKRLWKRKKKYGEKESVLKIEDIIYYFREYITGKGKIFEDCKIFETQNILMFGYLFSLAKFLTGKSDLNL